MKSDAKVIIGAIVASVVIIAGAVFLLGNDKSPKRESLGAATMTIDKTFEDFGDMKADEEKQPPSPLRIRAMRSSAFGMYPQAVIAHLQPWSLVEWRVANLTCLPT